MAPWEGRSALTGILRRERCGRESAMKTTTVLRLTGLCCVVGGAGLCVLFVSPGGCLGDGCNSRPLPGTGQSEAPWGLATVAFLLAAGVGLFAGAGRRIPVRQAGVAAALCAAGGALFAAAAGIAIAKTGGETWLMPVFVFPALLLPAATGIVVGAIVLRAQLVPRWIAVALIVAASLLPLFQSQSPGNFIPAVLGLVIAVMGTHLLVRAGKVATPVNEPGPRAVG